MKEKYYLYSTEVLKPVKGELTLAASNKDTARELMKIYLRDHFNGEAVFSQVHNGKKYIGRIQDSIKFEAK